ncbi:hypothetical protein LXA43DRAFT_1099933 [Ganoderma leucocontextum]|nr:hypothetical protein LXA43DRAFT_1099933 [Ganoderma leucocontextum]
MALARIDPEDRTTGNPKVDGVPPPTPTALPSYHRCGLVVNLHFVLYPGLTLVVARGFVVEKYLQNIQRYRITHFRTMVPPQVVLLCKHPLSKQYDLSSVVVGAVPLSPELSAELVKCSRTRTSGRDTYVLAICCSSRNPFEQYNADQNCKKAGVN